MKKFEVYQQLYKHGVVAVLRGSSGEEALEMAEQSLAGGIGAIEVTMTTPGALEAIRGLAGKYGGDSGENAPVIGAGTVLDAETARLAILAGAQFVVSPSFQQATVTVCHRYRVPVLPGIMTVSEALQALEAGVDVVKLFPGNLYAPGTIKTLQGPLPQLNVMPTGGVNLDNLGQWIANGAFAVGIGSDLTAEAVKTGDFAHVRAKAAQYMEKYREFAHTRKFSL